MDMKRNVTADGGSGGNGLEQMLSVGIPENLLSTLIDMVAMGQSCVCDGRAVTNTELRQAMNATAQILYQQAHEMGGADAAWRSPQDGTYHHPTFSEQQGEAWEAMQLAINERVEIRLVEMITEILVERSRACNEVLSDPYAHYEHLCQDIVESSGLKGLLKALIL